MIVRVDPDRRLSLSRCSASSAKPRRLYSPVSSSCNDRVRSSSSRARFAVMSEAVDDNVAQAPCRDRAPAVSEPATSNFFPVLVTH